MKVAFTSSDGTRVDQHYGSAERFFVWEVGPEAASCVASVEPAPPAADTEATAIARADLLKGCAILWTLQIGGPAAARLVARHVHPLKVTGEVPVAAMVERLQGVLRGRPPPWLRKALGAVTPPCPEESAP